MPFDLFDTPLCAAMLLSPEGRVLRAGTGCSAILQWPAEELVGADLLALCEPGHGPRIERALRNVRSGAPSAAVRAWFPRPNGVLRLLLRIAPGDEGLVAVVEDVSERATVIEKSSQLESLVDYAADAWFVHDMEGRLRDANPWAWKSLGYTREEMLGLVVADFEATIKPGRFDGVWNRMEVGKPMTVQGRHRRKDGSEFPVEVRLGLFATEDDEVLMLAICRDITERKKTEAALEAMNERLETEVAERTRELRQTLAERQAMLDHLVDGFVAVDRSERVLVANPALAALLGIPPLQPGDGASTLPPGLHDLVRAALIDRAPFTAELPLPGDRTAKATVSPTWSHDELLGAVALVRDVTLEKEIDRMKTDFIATVSHELRTPLTSVLGFAKLTRNKLVERVFPLIPADDTRARRVVEQSERNLDIIVSEGERLTSLINDVLDISKMEAGRMEWRFHPVDLGALVRRAAAAVSALFGAGGPELVVDVEEDLPLADGDEDRLLQVLINLLSNASKFTTEGTVTLGAHGVTGGVELSVADTGRGIEAAHQASVFDKFKQVGDTLTDKPKGTGLGLPICAQIVAAHGSHFTLRSALGAGSRFAFVLATDETVDRSTTADEPVRDAIRSVSRRGPTSADILVVDDDPNLRELLCQELQDRGYGVRTATNGYDAIAAVRARRPDVVVLDVMMPDISGFDVAAVLKNDPRTEDVPILILSIVKDTERGRRLGVDRYLTKPAEGDALAEALAELISQVGLPPDAPGPVGLDEEVDR